MAQQTAVQFIEEGIKAREKHWQDQYQQGYQRALSDIMLYIEEAKQMEKEQIVNAWRDGDNDSMYEPKQLDEQAEQYYNENYKK